MNWVEDELASLERANLLRHPRTLESAQEPEVTIDGRRVVLLCSNNYLGLAADARVRAAAAGAARKWGAGSGASRLVSGTTSLHRELEEALARHEQTEDAVLFSSGYLANLGVITTLTGPEDVVFSDELNHASIVDACRLSKARVAVYRHADVDHLAHLLEQTTTRRRVVVTDTVFSMDGDLAPVAELSELCDRQNATLVTDEAHATGVIDTHELRGGSRVVVVGTLSKALGSAGGYIATTSAFAKLLRNRARTHVFDTASAPPTVAAAREALRIAQTEPWRRERACELAARIATELKRLGYEAGEPAAAVVPVIVGDARDALALAERLLDDGVFCPAIRPPSVAEGTSRLRVTVMATHTDEHIDRALAAFARARGAVRVRTPKKDRDPLETIRRAGGVFVTGTDTGVGKTIVTASIASCLARAGLRTAIYKPIQTGSADGADDAAFASRLSGCPGTTGVVLPEPLAPSVAARVADTSIDTDRLVEEVAELRAANDVVVVEGAGGWLVPIDGTYTMADLARELGLPLVVVARPALGTLNHTALTIEAARSRGLDVLGVIVSGFPSRPPLAERTNPLELERLCGTEVTGVLPTLEGLDVERGALPAVFEPDAWLGPRLGGRFDRDAFVTTLKMTSSRTALLR